MKKKYVEITIISLLSLAVVALILNWTIRAVIHNRTEVIVPKLEGKPLLEALDICSSLRLGITKEGEEFNSKLPPGTVIRQIPYPGMTVREGKTIRVTLSKGSDLVFVPDIKGQTTKVAELIIRKEQLIFTLKDQVYSLKYDKNKIISQTPEANSIVEKNGSVEVLVSLGAPPEGMILMSDFVGKDIDEFKKWSEKNKVVYQVKEEDSEASPVDVVVSQDPPPDTIITYSIPITIGVSKGSQVALFNPNQPAGEIFHYDVPQGAKEQKIQIVLIDSTGEHQIRSGTELPGSKIEVPIMKKGKAKIRVFINNILVEEKEL